MNILLICIFLIFSPLAYCDCENYLNAQREFPLLNITLEDHSKSLGIDTKYTGDLIFSSRTFERFKIACTASYPIEIYFNYNLRSGCKLGIFEANTSISKLQKGVYEYKNEIEIKNFVPNGNISCVARNDHCLRKTLFPHKLSGEENDQDGRIYELLNTPGDPMEGYPSWEDRSDKKEVKCNLMLYYNKRTKNWLCEPKGSNITTFKVKWFRNAIELKMIMDNFRSTKSCFEEWDENKDESKCPNCRKLQIHPLYTNTGNSQVFECVGTQRAGVYKAIFFPLKNKTIITPEFFYELKDAKPYSQSLIYIANVPPHDELYTFQKITPSCYSHVFYFSYGTQWFVRYKNRTDNSTFSEAYVSRGGQSSNQMEYLYYNSTVEPITVTSEMSEIVCLAPVSNSVEFVETVYKINVYKISDEPKYIGKDINQTVQISSSQSLLMCKFFGKPIPAVIWSKDGIVESINNASITNKNSEKDDTVISTLMFKTIDNNLAGRYTCEASNFRGTKSNSFFVELKASNLAVILISFFAILIAVILFGAFAYQWVQAKKAKFALRALTDVEIDFFEFGNKSVAVDENDYTANATNQPYNLDYEIPKEHLIFDEKDVLGSGAFGQVIKGQLIRCGGDDQSQIYGNASLTVAIKSVKPSADIEYFKALLSEIKIMIFVGNGKNVVNLHGACTRNIKERDLFIVTEFCKNGSLDSFIEKNKKNFIDSLKDSKSTSNYENQPENKPKNKYENEMQITFDSEMLLKWSRDIAEGMEFLSAKRIIHCDLATRNVLLTDNYTAKVGDFGLSRQLLENSNYKKSTVVPLPWRWMAIETLKELRFSHESDVWAYGVTLWEMFTLGEVPFANQRWDEGFVKNLESGFRLFRPKYSSNNIYNIMLDCWDENQKNRPKFGQLKQNFENILINHKKLL